MENLPFLLRWVAVKVLSCFIGQMELCPVNLPDSLRIYPGFWFPQHCMAVSPTT